MQDERYFMEINPFDKIDEIMEAFKDFSPKIFTKTDDGYDWLEEDDSKCIVFANSYGGQSLEIDVGDMGEFTLCYDWHAHYANYQYDYDLMIERIRDIFENRICCGNITDSEGKWFGSGYFDKAEIQNTIIENFTYTFGEKEFSDHLIKSGYTVTYTFWNPIDNKTITVKPE